MDMDIDNQAFDNTDDFDNNQGIHHLEGLDDDSLEADILAI